MSAASRPLSPKTCPAKREAFHSRKGSTTVMNASSDSADEDEPVDVWDQVRTNGSVRGVGLDHKECERDHQARIDRGVGDVGP